jgi:lysophospholipase L1-like esterase
MKIMLNKLSILFLLVILLGCSSENSIPFTEIPPLKRQINYLALGDSYTIGQSVCTSCRFPEQLKSGLQNAYPNDTFSLQIIATTGWTTGNLISAINEQNPKSNYDLVTLLIGVNNQYQNQSFSIYEQEFPLLVSKAIALAKGDKSNVIVVSIPDYAFTPFGNGSRAITFGVEQYNTFAKNYCMENNIEFVNITDITQQGINNPSLVASDGLHPSELAYAKFVERILPKAIPILVN